MIKDLIQKNRSRRRFDQSIPVETATLKELVDCARLSPSARNLQPLKFMFSNQPGTNRRVFDCLSWAGYLEDWPGPEEGERPTGYIILLLDKKISESAGIDSGIAAQSILLAAVEKDLGGCILGSVDRDRLRAELQIPAHLEILLVIALGRPKEIVVIEKMNSTGDVRYYRDAQGVHHVPKRSLDDLVLIPVGATVNE